MLQPFLGSFPVMVNNKKLFLRLAFIQGTCLGLWRRKERHIQVMQWQASSRISGLCVKQSWLKNGKKFMKNFQNGNKFTIGRLQNGGRGSFLSAFPKNLGTFQIFLCPLSPLLFATEGDNKHKVQRCVCTWFAHRCFQKYFYVFSFSYSVTCPKLHSGKRRNPAPPPHKNQKLNPALVLSLVGNGRDRGEEKGKTKIQFFFSFQNTNWNIGNIFVLF